MRVMVIVFLMALSTGVGLAQTISNPGSAVDNNNGSAGVDTGSTGVMNNEINNNSDNSENNADMTGDTTTNSNNSEGM